MFVERFITRRLNNGRHGEMKYALLIQLLGDRRVDRAEAPVKLFRRNYVTRSYNIGKFILYNINTILAQCREPQ